MTSKIRIFRKTYQIGTKQMKKKNYLKNNKNLQINKENYSLKFLLYLLFPPLPLLGPLDSYLL